MVALITSPITSPSWIHHWMGLYLHIVPAMLMLICWLHRAMLVCCWQLKVVCSWWCAAKQFFLKKIFRVVSICFSLASETVEGHNKRRTFFTLRAPPGLRVQRYCLFFYYFNTGLISTWLYGGNSINCMFFFSPVEIRYLLKNSFQNTAAELVHQLKPTIP